MDELTQDLFFEGYDGKKIFAYVWNNVNSPKGIVQIFHGMCEHGKRYHHFAAFLNANGFIVYANDHRGHGKTAGSIQNLGYVGEKGFSSIVEDTFILTKLIKAKHPNLPVIILGHSFGAFVAQEYLSRYSAHINGMILSGSAMQKGLSTQIGTFISLVEHSTIDNRKPDYLMNLLCFGPYNRKFKDSKFAFRWLSSDKNEVIKYENDPYCGAIFPINFFYQFLNGIKSLYKKENLERIRKDLPLLLISGALDPVGNYSKSVQKLYKLYVKTGLQDISLKIFPNGRHEILNEINRLEVYHHILDWMNEKLNASP